MGGGRWERALTVQGVGLSQEAAGTTSSGILSPLLCLCLDKPLPRGPSLLRSAQQTLVQGLALLEMCPVSPWHRPCLLPGTGLCLRPLVIVRAQCSSTRNPARPWAASCRKLPEGRNSPPYSGGGRAEGGGRGAGGRGSQCLARGPPQAAFPHQGGGTAGCHTQVALQSAPRDAEVGRGRIARGHVGVGERASAELLCPVAEERGRGWVSLGPSRESWSAQRGKSSFITPGFLCRNGHTYIKVGSVQRRGYPSMSLRQLIPCCICSAPLPPRARPPAQITPCFITKPKAWNSVT